MPHAGSARLLIRWNSWRVRAMALTYQPTTANFEGHAIACPFAVLTCHRGATHTPCGVGDHLCPPSHGKPSTTASNLRLFKAFGAGTSSGVRTLAHQLLCSLGAVEACLRRPSIPACALLDGGHKDKSGRPHQQVRAREMEGQVGQDGRLPVGRCHSEGRASSTACSGLDHCLCSGWVRANKSSRNSFKSHVCLVLPPSVCVCVFLGG